MTTSDEVKFLQDRSAGQRGRVIVAAQTADATDLDATGTPRIIQAAMMALVAEWRSEAEWWEASTKKGKVATSKSLRDAATRLAGFAVGLTTRPVEMPETSDAELPGMWEQSDLTGGETDTEPTQCIHPRESRSILKGGATMCTACGQRFEQTGPEFVAEGLAADDPNSAQDDAHLDATLAFLTGATDVVPGPPMPPSMITPTAATDDPFQAFLDGTTTEQENVMALVSSQPVSPFLNPGPPGAGAYAVNKSMVVPFVALDALAAQLPPREYLSHSYVSTYEGCSLRTLLERASRHNLAGPSRPGWSMLGGSAFHTLVADIERTALLPGAPTPSVELIKVDELWKEHLQVQIDDTIKAHAGDQYENPNTWHVANGGRENYDWWRVSGADMIKRYLDFHTAEWRAHHLVIAPPPVDGAAQPPIIEWEFTLNVDGIPDRGDIDIARYSPTTGLVTVIDYKTGAREPDESSQLAGYGYALAKILMGWDNTPGRIFGQYWLARKGIYTNPVDLFATYSWDELAYRFRTATRGTQGGVFVPNVTNMCSACSVSALCPAKTR